MRPALRPFACLGLLSLALAACKQTDSVADVLLVARVDVTPPTAALGLQEELQLEATPKTSGGLPLPAREVSWSSSAPTIVSVSATGLVRALAVGGPVTIRATVEGIDGQAAVSVTPAPVDHITVLPVQSNVPLGGTSHLNATAYDAAGGVLAGRSFSWSSSAPAIAPVTTDGLVVAQSLGGPVTITAASGGKSGTASVTVINRPATRLGFVQQPGPSTAGQPIVPAVRVAIQDDFLSTVTTATNSVTIALAGNPGGATLSGTKTVAAVNGVATFSNLSLDRTGAGYTLLATASGLSSTTSMPFDVGAGSANRLSFSTAPPSTARSGIALSPAPVLQLRDGAGNPVALAGIVITASIASGPGALSGGTTASTNGSGAASFSNLVLTGTAGNYTVAFSAAGILSITSGTIALGAGLPTALSVVTQPSSSSQSGVPLVRQPAVQLLDLSGNEVDQGGVAITASIASGPAGASLGGTTVVTTDGTGLARYTNLSLTGPAGSYVLRFAGSGLASATSNTIVLGAGGGTNLAITTQPSATVASGVVFPSQPVVQLRDGANNPVAQAGVLVTASIQTGGGTLGGTVTIATTTAGAASFSDLSIQGTAGNRTLVFAASGYVSAVSNTIAVTAGSASQLGIVTQPSSSVTSGSIFPQQPVIQVTDAGGNPVGGIVVTVAIASGAGTLGGTLTAVSAANGSAGFTDLMITGAPGIRTLSFSAPGVSTVTSGTISVGAGAATQLAITTQPSSSVPSGTVFPQQPVVQATDASNNPVAGVVVTASIASGGGTLGGTATATTNASGAAAFTDLSITGSSGDRTLDFSAAGIPAVISNKITVTASASQLSITTQPSSTAQSGVVFARQPVILVRDASNAPVSGITVTVVIATGGGTLGGTTTAISNSSGVASFTDLSISGLIGSHTLSFSTTGAPTVTSSTINLTAGPASQLVIVTQPSASALAGVSFLQQPVIRLKDAAGNNVSQSGFAVTAAIDTGTGGGTLGGTLTVNTTNNGTATYSNLKISKAGSYTLIFSSGALTPVVSWIITVN